MQTGCDYIFSNEAHVCRWWFFFFGGGGGLFCYGTEELSNIHVRWLLASAWLVSENNWPIATLFMLPQGPPPPTLAPPPALRPRKRFIVQAGSEANRAWSWLAVLHLKQSPSSRGCIWSWFPVQAVPGRGGVWPDSVIGRDWAFMHPRMVGIARQ